MPIIRNNPTTNKRWIVRYMIFINFKIINSHQSYVRATRPLLAINTGKNAVLNFLSPFYISRKLIKIGKKLEIFFWQKTHVSHKSKVTELTQNYM